MWPIAALRVALAIVEPLALQCSILCHQRGKFLTICQNCKTIFCDTYQHTAMLFWGKCARLSPTCGKFLTIWQNCKTIFCDTWWWSIHSKYWCNRHADRYWHAEDTVQYVAPPQWKRAQNNRFLVHLVEVGGASKLAIKTVENPT